MLACPSHQLGDSIAIVALRYGAGLRLQECLELCVKNLGLEGRSPGRTLSRDLDDAGLCAVGLEEFVLRG
jgi:hypothetical protein